MAAHLYSRHAHIEASDRGQNRTSAAHARKGGARARGGAALAARVLGRRIRAQWHEIAAPRAQQAGGAPSSRADLLTDRSQYCPWLRSTAYVSSLLMTIEILVIYLVFSFEYL